MAERVASRSRARPRAATRSQASTEARTAWLPAALFGLACLPRLLYLFWFSDPENPGDGLYTDAYHHWQIGYLTLQDGLARGRLWDLKGMEYFWGALHPLLLAALFAVSGSHDLVVDRLLSAAAGAATVVLLFYLCRRHWGTAPAVATALMAAVLPVAVFNDSAGMEEQLAFALVLAGLLLMPQHSFWAGAALGLAALDRSEFWLVGLALVALACWSRAPSRRAALIWGWALVMGGYVLFLLLETGNPVYPLYWNYLGNAAGHWIAPASAAQLAVRAPLLAAFAAAAAGLGATLWKRPRGFLLLAFGCGYAAFATGFYALTPFLSDWQDWTWFSRHFEFVYEFVALLLAVGLFRLLPARLPAGLVRPAAVTAVVLVAVLAQLMWRPITAEFGPTAATWAATRTAGTQVGAEWAAGGRRGVVNIPATAPDFTYALVRFGGVDAHHLIGQFYDPYSGAAPGWSFAGHPTTTSTLMACWFAATDSTLWVVPRGQSEYQALLAAHPGWFRLTGRLSRLGWSVYRVAAPRPSPAACAAAWRASRA